MTEYTRNLAKWSVQICAKCKASSTVDYKPTDPTNFNCSKCRN